MILLMIRIVLAFLAVGFFLWLGYVIYLGLKTFFTKNGYDNADHRKQRGRTAPNKVIN